MFAIIPIARIRTEYLAIYYFYQMQWLGTALVKIRVVNIYQKQVDS